MDPVCGTLELGPCLVSYDGPTLAAIAIPQLVLIAVLIALLVLKVRDR